MEHTQTAHGAPVGGPGGERPREARQVVVPATGRRPVLEGIGLESEAISAGM